MRLLTADELAQIFQVSVQRIYEMARTGLLPVVRLGRQVRFDEEKLRQWIDNGGRALPGGWKMEEV